MSSTFRAATRLEPAGEGVYSTIVPDGWQQGRGAFGGLVLGYLVRGACAAESDPTRTLRTLAADIAGPVLPGPAEVNVRTLRRGRSQTNLHVELSQQGEVLASGVCTLSGPRPVSLEARLPEAPADAHRSWSELTPFSVAAPSGSGGPVFAQHYEYRNLGPLPFRGGPEGVTAGFVSERGADGELDAASITALLDAWFPAIFSIAKSPMPTATVSFASQYLGLEQPLSAAEPLYFRARMHTLAEGYFVEFRELWQRERLVALNQQTFAVLR